MPKQQNQKLKILYLMDFLNKMTDEEHPVSLKEMQAYLETQGIPSERRSISDDLEVLALWGMDIIKTGNGRSTAYYVGARDFELPEVKLMVDSVQSSKFITQAKTISLIKKIEGMTSIFQAKLLARNVFVKNRIKSMNESIYYNIDAIHNGLSKNRKIRFHYFEYTVAKERRLRHDGTYYTISPFALTWDDENYYLVGYDSQAGLIKHFRVDKMMDISTTNEERDGQKIYDALDMAIYAKKVFGMFSGEEERVKLRFENHLVGAVIDRFGKEVMIIPDGNDHFTVSVDVVISPQFFAWVCGFGKSVKVIGPDEVVRTFKEHVKAIASVYTD